VIFYRQDILDQLGLAYPDPNWTYADAARIWQAATGQNQDGTHRAGASFYWHSEALPFWLAGWGAQYMNAAQDRATMASAEGGAAVSYVEDLFKAGAAIDGEQNPLLLPRAQAVFAQYHSAHVINIGVGNLGNRYKWDLLPNPVWPRGRTTFVTIDCYMLNARTKHQSEAWTLLKWISGAEGDLAWPKFQIQISLVTPSLISLWDYWEKTIVQVAPVLEGKALHWFYDAAKNGYDYPQLFFRYNPLSADALVNTWLGDIGAGKVGVRLGLQQMQNQVNALEQTATPPLSLQQTIAAERKALQGMQAMFAGARNG
jgi:ABC-type glycerol-3-phosphate transport system substrate-binding protein